MKTKKILSLLLAAMMLLSASMSVSAASITTNGGVGSTVVTYGTDQGFTVTIPADFTIDPTTKKATAEVSASNVMIAHGNVLEVTVSGHDYTDKWELIDKAEATNKLTYTIGKTEGAADITNNSVVLDVAAGEAPASTVTEKMYFTVTDTLTKAGTYQDTLTFTVSIENGAPTANVISFSNFHDNEGKTTNHQALEGMTWEQFVNSEYNLVIVGTPGEEDYSESYLYTISGGKVYCNDWGANLYNDNWDSGTYSAVLSTDVIIAGHEYYCYHGE